VRWVERSSKGLWSRLGWRVIPVMVVLLFPWPGLGESFSIAFGHVCNAIFALNPGGHSEIRFLTTQRDREHPWWLLLSVTNVVTGASFRIPVDTRTVAYIRMAVFLSLALGWPLWKTRRGLKALAVGVALLALVMGLTLLFPLLQMLGMVNVLGLGVFGQSVLSVGILTLVSYPSMAFAIPGLIWWLTLRLADAPPAPPSAPAAAEATSSPV
jgi:hypothetical protein